MSSLLSKSFVIELTNFSESTPRGSRRIIINADVVKAVKLCAGDAVALSDPDNAENTKVSIQCFRCFCIHVHMRSLDLTY